MQIHDVSLVSVYYSVWGVIDAINTTEDLAYHFPNHERQREIAEGFRRKSGVGFDKIIGDVFFPVWEGEARGCCAHFTFHRRRENAT